MKLLLLFFLKLQHNETFDESTKKTTQHIHTHIYIYIQVDQLPCWVDGPNTEEEYEEVQKLIKDEEKTTKKKSNKKEQTWSVKLVAQKLEGDVCPRQRPRNWNVRCVQMNQGRNKFLLCVRQQKKL